MERKSTIDLRCVCSIEFQQGTSGEFTLSTFSEDHVFVADNKVPRRWWWQRLHESHVATHTFDLCATQQETATAWVTAIKRVIAAAQRPRFETRFGEQATATDIGGIESVLVRRSTKLAFENRSATSTPTPGSTSASATASATVSSSASVTPTASESTSALALEQRTAVKHHTSTPSTPVSATTPVIPRAQFQYHHKAASMPVFRSDDEDSSSTQLTTSSTSSTSSTSTTSTTSTTSKPSMPVTVTSDPTAAPTESPPIDNEQLDQASPMRASADEGEAATATPTSSSASSAGSTTSFESNGEPQPMSPRSQSTPEISARSASSSVLLTGNLKKREGLTLGPTWRKRYCVLVDAPYRELRYYDSQQTSLAKEIIDVTGIVEVEPVVPSEKPEFVVATNRSRYHFRCKTEAERDAWVAAIRKVIVNWSMRNVLHHRKPTRHRNSKQRPAGVLALQALSRPPPAVVSASASAATASGAPHALRLNLET